MDPIQYCIRSSHLHDHVLAYFSILLSLCSNKNNNNCKVVGNVELYL